MITTYARRLGVFSATMAVVGGIIGGGIFRSPAEVAARVGSAGLTLAVWVLGGLVALAGAFCYGELGARMPRAGGQYVYLRDAFGPLPAFLYGWILLLVIATGATAAIAVTFAQYAAPLLGLSTAAQVPLAVGAIVLLAGINYLGVKPGAIVQNIFTILKLLALAVLIIAGIFIATSTAPYRPLPPPSAQGAGLWRVVGAVGAALVPVLFTCGGWQQTNFIAEEIIEPERNLPRALVLGVVIVVVVYVLANVAYLETLGAAGLAASTAPAADAMRVALGPGGATLIAVGIALSTFGFLNLVILVTPRVFQAMAADGLFFAGIARLHPRYRTPAAAIAFQAAWAILLTLWGKYGQLLDYVVFGDWIFFGLSVATLFVYRWRDAVRDRLSAPSLRSGKARPPDRPVFRTPGYPWVPGFFVLAALYVMTGSVLSNPANALRGAALLAFGIPVFWLWRRQRLAASRDGA